MGQAAQHKLTEGRQRTGILKQCRCLLNGTMSSGPHTGPRRHLLECETQSRTSHGGQALPEAHWCSLTDTGSMWALPAHSLAASWHTGAFSQAARSLILVNCLIGASREKMLSVWSQSLRTFWSKKSLNGSIDMNIYISPWLRAQQRPTNDTALHIYSKFVPCPLVSRVQAVAGHKYLGEIHLYWTDGLLFSFSVLLFLKQYHSNCLCVKDILLATVSNLGWCKLH